MCPKMASATPTRRARGGYAVGQVLLSARAFIMPYNTAIPDVESIARRDADRVFSERKHHFIRGLILGIGVWL